MTSASSSLPFAEELSDFEDENSLSKSAFIDVFETNKQVRKIVPALTRLLAEQGKPSKSSGASQICKLLPL